MTREDLSDNEEEVAEEVTGIATVERLSSVDVWEMFRVMNQDTGLRIASIALGTPRGGARDIAFAVWRARDVEEPLATGSVDHNVLGAPWDDRARESVLRQVLCHYEDELRVESDKAEFRLAAPRESSAEEGSDVS
ncbi:MAG: hypothetical protein ABJE95_18635 [Byssovorax sp.]